MTRDEFRAEVRLLLRGYLAVHYDEHFVAAPDEVADEILEILGSDSLVTD